jgi:hypothetical protein
MTVTPLVSIRASEATESGLFKGTHPLDTPLWRDGRNVIFRDGGPEKIPGWVSVVDDGAVGIIRGMGALQDEAAVQRLFWGDQTQLYMWNGASVTQLGTGFTGHADETGTHPATAWSFERFGNWSLATNGLDAPQIWKATGSYGALAGVHFDTAEIFLRRGPHILAFNLTGWAAGNGKSTFAWCDADNPEIWQTTGTNTAGDIPIRDMDGEIKAAVPFGDQIALFGKNDMFVVSYTGAPYYFGYQPTLKGIGALGKMAVVEVNRQIYGYGEQGIWRTDGVTFDYLDTLPLRAFLKSIIDIGQLSKVAATYDAGSETVMWSIPTAEGGGENALTIAYRIPNGSFSILDFGRTAWVPGQGVHKVPVGADRAGGIHFHGTGADADGAAIDAWVQTKPFAARDARMWTYLDSLALEMRRKTGSVQVRVGAQKHLNDALSWGPYKDIATGFDPIRYRKSGRFLTLEIRSNAVGADFAMSGFDAYGSQAGRI